MSMDKSNDIKVSICCLVYNHEKYLRKCFDGFIMQKTNFRFEVIVHDDASTDASADIIREYETRYPDIFKPIYQTQNQFSLNTPVTWKFLYGNSKGDYIAFCEGDDYWTDENKLQRQFDIMENDPELSMCVHKTRFVYDDGEPSETVKPDPEHFPKEGKYGDFGYTIEKDYCPFHTTSLFFRRKFVSCDTDARPDFYRICRVGDYPTILHMLSEGAVYYIPEEMSHYRAFRKGNWTSELHRNIKNEIANNQNLVDTFTSFNAFTNGKYEQALAPYLHTFRFTIHRFQKDWTALHQPEFINDYKALSFKERVTVFLSKIMPHVMKRYYAKKNK